MIRLIISPILKRLGSLYSIFLKKAGYQTAMFGKLHFGNNLKDIDDLIILHPQGHDSFVTNDYKLAYFFL